MDAHEVLVNGGQHLHSLGSVPVETFDSVELGSCLHTDAWHQQNISYASQRRYVAPGQASVVKAALVRVVLGSFSVGLS